MRHDDRRLPPLRRCLLVVRRHTEHVVNVTVGEHRVPDRVGGPGADGIEHRLRGLVQAGVDEHEPVRRLERDHVGEAGHHRDPVRDECGDAHRGAVREQPAHRGLAPPHPLGVLGECVHETLR